VSKAGDVLQTISDLHQRGKTIVLISHRLEDILAVCTRIAVFVRGRVAHELTNDGVTMTELIHFMFGDVQERWSDRQQPSGVDEQGGGR
jgi:ABC-type sugar transport system ATPase subunit